jgi:uncharacterized protein
MAVECLFLVLTAQCNLSCSYCYQNARKDRRLEWDALKAGMDLAFSSESPELTLVFSGGEPLIELDLIHKALEHAAQTGLNNKRLRYALTTNGLLITEAVADYLDEKRVKIQLSFDGVSQAQDYRGRHTFKALDRLLDLLRQKHPDLFRERLRISMTVIPPTIRYVPDSVTYLLGKDVREIAISAEMTSNPEWTAEAAAVLDEQIGMIADISKHHLERTGEVPLTVFRKNHEGSSRNEPALRECNATTGKILTLDADGKLYTCPLFARSYQSFPDGSRMAELSVFRIGDVRDPEVAVLCGTPSWANSRRNLFGSMVGWRSSYGACRDCGYLGRCSICPVSIWHTANAADQDRVPDFLCAFNRTILKYQDEFPSRPGRSWQTSANDPDPIEILENALREKRKHGAASVEPSF